MKSKQLKLRVGAGALMLAALPLAVTQALAATQLLRADTVSVTMPGGAIVPMWGYAADNAVCGSGGVTVPGPAVTVPPTDTTLTVTLKNCLPEPSSVVINGQLASAVAPVWIEPALIPNGLGGQKANPAFPNTYTGSRPAGNVTAVARSFTAEAAALGGIQTYTWGSATSPLKPGSYLYQSGTHPQVQVQMGLYGALTKDAATGVAYTQGTASAAYDTQVTLLYSEIDSALHAAVAAGTYGTTGPTSTLDYAPKYFLINGKPFDATTNPGPVASVAAGRTLLRFLNASLKTHVPEINGQYWKMIAEDGNPYPVLGNPRQQYTAFLTAGKTIDVMLNPPNAAARYAILDRRLYDTNNGAAGGGMLAYLDVTAAATAPVITSAAVTAATQGLAYSYTVTATDAPTDTLTYSLDTAPAGMTIVATTGAITWTPTNAQAVPVVVGGKPNSVNVRVTDQTGLFATQAFSVNVANVNDAPVAVNDSYMAIANSALSVLVANGVLKNDTDPDLDALSALLVGTPAGVTLNANGSFSLTAGFVGATAPATKTFQYNAVDNGTVPGPLPSVSPATVAINVIANRAPTAVADTKTVAMRRTSTLCATTLPDYPFNAQPAPQSCYSPVLLYVVKALPGSSQTGNDTDPDTAIDPTNVPTTPVMGTAPRYGAAVVDVATNTIRYTPNLNFRGTDSFSYRVKDNLGATSSTAATVRVNVQ